jgi:hypothetical protein
MIAAAIDLKKPWERWQLKASSDVFSFSELYLSV